MQSYSTLKAVTTRATVSGLKPGTRYVFQVRARTSAGCGRFSQAMEVETGKPRECRERGGRAGRARELGRARGSEEGNLPAGACWLGIFTAQRRKVTSCPRQPKPWLSLKVSVTCRHCDALCQQDRS